MRIDMSEPIDNDSPRSDVPHSASAILLAAAGSNLYEINLSNNVLDDDGAKAFHLFMEKNNTLHTLRLSNCGLGVKTPAIMLAS